MLELQNWQITITDYRDVYQIVCFKVMHLLTCLSSIHNRLFTLSEEQFTKMIQEVGRLSLIEPINVRPYQPFKKLLSALELPVIISNNRITKLCVKAIEKITKHFAMPLIKLDRKMFESEVLIFTSYQFGVLIRAAQTSKATIEKRISNILHLLCYD